MSSISLIVAAADNNVIGRDGQLPWRLATDLKRFKALTMGKPILMGRLTFEAIGRALPGRRNIVISSQPDYGAAGCELVPTPGAALALVRSEPEIMVIGGGTIYRELLPFATRIYMTQVHADLAGDTYFPALDEGEWEERAREEHAADASNDFGYAFITLERKR